MSSEPETAPGQQPGPVRVSIAAQLDALWRTGRAGEAGITDVQLFAEQMTAYLAQNLEAFAGPRGADVYVAVSVDRPGERAGHEYRSGRYVKETGAGEPAHLREKGA